MSTAGGGPSFALRTVPAQPADGRPRVLHLSRDFPDPLEPAKTSAIRRLIDLTADRFDHTVVSLNRRTPSFAALGQWLGRNLEVVEAPFEYGIAAEYRAPPWGIFHAAMLERLGDWLASRFADRPPSLIVGHKLTIEGIAVRHAARRLGVPYALTIQGNTDERILRARPDLAPLLGKVLHGAAAVFPLTPWALTAVERRLGTSAASPRMLPCATEFDTPMVPVPHGNGLITAFHLRNWRTKNFDRTVSALARLRKTGRPASLAVVGGGEGPEAERCRAIGDAQPGVSFEGPLQPADMRRRFNSATALIMPSRRESFGMVFIEALFAGIPIVYPAGHGVDGYFDGAEFAVRVDPRSTAAIAAAMAHVLDHEQRLKAALAEWQSGADAGQFQRAAIAAQFAAGLDEAIAARADSSAR